MNGGSRPGFVALVASGLLVFMAATEHATHTARDEESYRAGYSAASHTPAIRPGALTDARLGVAMCDCLFDVALDGGSTTLRRSDFRDGCTQAVRDANE